MPFGFVSLVGAGPGDPELITVKALRRLRAADVVIYDALANKELLTECRIDAELLDVGKRAGCTSATQSQINALLIDKACLGLQVVRLKGGDPFVFGRGGEEAVALTDAGIEWEVVPGVSSATAVPAYAGIPVTHRDVASSFAVITGHEAPDRTTSRIDWRALAQGIDTLVFLMSVSRLDHIAHQLITHGRSATTPAAVISRGSTSEQATVIATLETIAEAVAQHRPVAPATLVVGEVVRLSSKLQWFQGLPIEHSEMAF